jgi:hypothetical protein
MGQMSLIDEIVECVRVLDAQPVPDERWMFVPPWVIRAMARILGAPIGRHRRARGVRGRKRALCKSWRPVPADLAG